MTCPPTKSDSAQLALQFNLEFALIRCLKYRHKKEARMDNLKLFRIFIKVSGLFLMSLFIQLSGIAIAAEIKPTIRLWKQSIIINMPAAGTLKSLPLESSFSRTILDEVDLSAVIHEPISTPFDRSPYNFEITFYARDILQESRRRLETEFVGLQTEIKEFKESIGRGILSAKPKVDPLQVRVISNSDISRLEALRSLIRAHLWSEELVTKLSKEGVGKLPVVSLEKRVASLLDFRSINLLAALAEIDPITLRDAAASLLAQDIRTYSKVPNTTLPNPGAPFQKFRINDPALYSGHIVTSPLEEFSEQVEAYCLEATKYWTALEQTRLYNEDDLRILNIWNPQDSIIKPFVDAGSPSERIKQECSLWQKKRNEYSTSIKIIKAITTKGIYFGFKGEPAAMPPWDYLSGLTKHEWLSRWYATTVVKDLGLDPSYVDGHKLDWVYASEWWIKYLLLIMPRTGGTPVSISDLAAVMAWKLGPLVANQVVATNWELVVPHFMGGVKLQPPVNIIPGFAQHEKADMPSYFDSPTDLLKLPIYLTNLSFEEPNIIAQSAYKNPSSVSKILSSIANVGHNVEKEILWNNNASSSINRAWDTVWRDSYNEIDQFRLALLNTSRAEDIARALLALNESLGYSDLKTPEYGRIKLPSDSKVIAVYAREGEYADVKRPLLAVQHQYRSAGKLFLRQEEVKQLGIVAGMAYEISLSNQDALPSFFKTVALVHNISPNEQNGWTVDLDVFPVFEVNNFVGSTNGLPRFLPVQDRFCNPKLNLLSPEQCEAAKKIVPMLEEIQITFKNRII